MSLWLENLRRVLKNAYGDYLSGEVLKKCLHVKYKDMSALVRKMALHSLLQGQLKLNLSQMLKQTV